MFEEDIDMELENEKRHPTHTLVPVVEAPAVEAPTPTTTASSAPVIAALVTVTPVTEPVELPLGHELSTSSTSTHDVIQTESKPIHPTATVDRPDKASKLVPEGELESKETTEKKKEVDKTEDKQIPPKVESFAAAMTTSADIGSRFYIKRRIIIGNVSKYMAPGKHT